MALDLDSADLNEGAEQTRGIRELPDRRVGRDRRAAPRRRPELGLRHLEGQLARFSLVASVASVAVGVWALAHAPVKRTPTPGCGNSLGAQTFVHRALSPLWLVAVLLAIVAIAVPTTRQRSHVAMALVGLTIGLAVAALFRVNSWTTGICFA